MTVDSETIQPDAPEKKEAPKVPEGSIVEPSKSEKTPEQLAIDRKLDAAEKTSNESVAARVAQQAGETVDSETSEPPSEEQDEDEPGFLDSIVDYYNQYMKENPNASGTEVLFATAWNAFKGWFSGEKEEVKTEESEGGNAYRFDDETFSPDDPKDEKLLAQAKKQLEDMREKHPTWTDLAQDAAEKYDLGSRGAAMILAMSRFESGFNPDAKASSSSATGLGQFIKDTWGSYQKNLPEGDPHKGKRPTDPEASIDAIAWYSKANMSQTGLSLDDPHLVARLYEAHHEGASGAKKLWKFREGGPEGKIPSSYKGKAFTKFGVAKVETYKDYSDLVMAMSSRVESVARLYDTELHKSQANA